MPVDKSILREIVREELSTLLAARLGASEPRCVRRPRSWCSWMPVFLRALYENDGDVVRACAAVKPARSTIYAWRDRCPRYAAAWDRIVALRQLPSRPPWEAFKAEVLPASVLEWPDRVRPEEAA
ncbi:MAG TPA: hypothetical protein VGG06_23425 [Thermoanaerobaculia bacterium]|jgi:hypothetical protein